jgi:hypothetical protein
MIKITYLLIFCQLVVSCKKSNERLQIENGNSELERFITEYYSVMSQREWDTYKTFFADKAILTTIWQEPNDLEPKLLINSITEFLAQTGIGPDSQPIFEERPLKIDIKRKNNLANAWVYYEARFGTEDNLIEWRGYDLFSLLKFNEKWYIASITYVSDE